MNFQETEANSQTPGKKEMGEGWIGILVLMDAKYFMQMDNQVLLYSTGNYIQYPVINHNGKAYEKECVYMYN